mmetsp:Transcript_13748/g.20814  ORF Transcript_13748/g.20814 Transcript_13748/m.20814 type:complete len:288 (+) Transcript_13748:132-995(+)
MRRKQRLQHCTCHPVGNRHNSNPSMNVSYTSTSSSCISTDLFDRHHACIFVRETMTVQHDFTRKHGRLVPNHTAPLYRIVPIPGDVVITVAPKTRNHLKGIHVLVVGMVIPYNEPLHNSTQIRRMKHLVVVEFPSIDTTQVHFCGACTIRTRWLAAEICKIGWIRWSRSPGFQTCGACNGSRECLYVGNVVLSRSMHGISSRFFHATNHDIGTACGYNTSRCNATGKIRNVYTILGQELHFTTRNVQIEFSIGPSRPKNTKTNPFSWIQYNGWIQISIHSNKEIRQR